MPCTSFHCVAAQHKVVRFRLRTLKHCRFVEEPHSLTYADRSWAIVFGPALASSRRSADLGDPTDFRTAGRQGVRRRDEVLRARRTSRLIEVLVHLHIRQLLSPVRHLVVALVGDRPGNGLIVHFQLCLVESRRLL